jgi:leucyl-tRNA synthetase
MYTRFITMAFKDIGLIDFDEPFKSFRAHGLLIKDGAKMSKSKGNVVKPDYYFEKFGTDTFRAYLMFLGPYTEGGDFRDAGIKGVRRYAERVWRYVVDNKFSDAPLEDPELLNLLHKTIRKVTLDIEELRYNTAIAMLMEFLNALYKTDVYPKVFAETLLKLTAPFMPYITHELWEQMGNEGMIVDAPWPKYDESLIREETVTLVLQVNGKIRARVEMPIDMSEKETLETAKTNDRVVEWLEGKTIIKAIHIKNKLVNFVVR